MAIIGKPKISFQILNTNDPNTLLVADNSNWNNIENAPATLSIKIPGNKNYETFTFPKNKITWYNSQTLHLSCVECGEDSYEPLPDGIYHFLLEGTPNSYSAEREYLKTDTLRRSINKIWIQNGLEYDPASKLLKALMKIEFHLNRAKAFAHEGYYSQAQKSYDEAQKLTKANSGCKDCI